MIPHSQARVDKQASIFLFGLVRKNVTALLNNYLEFDDQDDVNLTLALRLVIQLLRIF